MEKIECLMVISIKLEKLIIRATPTPQRLKFIFNQHERIEFRYGNTK